MYLLWLRVAAVLYGLASVSALPAVLGDRPRWQRICLPVTIAGWIFHFVAFVEMLAAAHRLMPVGMHQVQSTLSLLIVTAFLLIWLRYRDRKSTRLNSSHQIISYAVFCLKKK